MWGKSCRIMKWYSSSIKNNIKANIIIIGLIPVIIIMGIGHFIVTAIQWNTILNDAQIVINKEANNINLELENYIRVGIYVVTNKSILSGLEEDFGDSTEKNYVFNILIESQLEKYREPTADVETEFVIYNNNPTLFNSPVTQKINSIDNDIIREKVLNISGKEVIWDNSEKEYIYLYRSFTGLRKYKCILKIAIPFNNIDKMLNNTIIKNNFITFNEQAYYGEGDRKDYSMEECVSISADVNNNSKIYSYIPKYIKRGILYKSLTVCIGILFIYTIILFVISNVLSKFMTHKLDDFIQEINNEELLLNSHNIDIGNIDELAFIKRRIIELINRVYEANKAQIREKKEKQKFEIEFLQSKINLHLLYNSLSVLKWNSLRSNNEKMADLIDCLVEYYREILSNGEQAVTIRREIELIKKYIQIVEQARSQKYNVIIEIDEEVMEAPVLKHTLQPIVENSLLHGIRKKDNAVLTITGHMENEKIVIKILDNGLGIPKEKLEEINSSIYESKYISYGLKNTRRRIKLYYGKECDIYLTSQIGEGTIATIIIENISKEELVKRLN